MYLFRIISKAVGSATPKLKGALSKLLQKTDEKEGGSVYDRLTLKQKVSQMIDENHQRKVALRHFRDYHKKTMKWTPERLFDKFDVNGNGIISRVEFVDGCRYAFLSLHFQKHLYMQNYHCGNCRI